MSDCSTTLSSTLTYPISINATTHSIPSFLAKRKKEIHDVLIVYPFTYVNPYANYPPLAAEYLQAGVIASGKKVTLLDMRFEKDIGHHIERADLVCLYGFFEDCSIFGNWKIHVISEVLEQIPDDIPVVAGGTGFRNPEEALQRYPKVDVVIRGLPDTPIRELLESGSPKHVQNLVYRQGNEFVRTPSITHPLSNEVYPRRHLRNPAYEYSLLGIPVDLVRAAVGCNYRCKFCYAYGKDIEGNFLRWQGRSPESQFKELSEIDAPLILWVDDDMTTDMEALDKLADLLIEHKVKKHFVGTGRVDHILKSNVEVLQKLEQAGFVAMAFGIESLNNVTLKFYRKAQTAEQVEQAMKMMSQTNILLVCNFLLGSPGETEEDMMGALDFGRRWQVDTLVTNRIKVPEGSEIHNIIYDPETGKEKVGMERIKDDALYAIKCKIKYGQRTPSRLLLTFLKMYRHRGLAMDPLYFACRLLETATRYTWLEKTRLISLLLYIPKKVTQYGAFRTLTKGLAVCATPPAKALNWAFEAIDRRLHISTAVLPAIFDLFKKRVLRKQKERVQITRDSSSVRI